MVEPWHFPDVDDQHSGQTCIRRPKLIFWRCTLKHIRILTFIWCTCLVSSAWGQKPASNPLNNWSEFHRTDMERYNPYENLLNVQNAPELELKWSRTTGGKINSSPAVINGVVYIASWDCNVYAFNAITGAKLWSYATGGPIYSSVPAVAKGVVYISSDDSNLYALNAKTGAKLWSYATEVGESAPAVANGMVYVGSYDEQTVYAFGLP